MMQSSLDDNRRNELPHRPGSADLPEIPPEFEDPVDESIVERAYRWSFLVLLCVGAVLAAAIFYARKQAVPTYTRVASPSARRGPANLTAEIPRVPFTDITSEAGIHFVHFNGAYGEKLLPETMGGGVAFFDYDRDGDQDLLYVNSANWPWRPLPGARTPTAALYANDGTGKFTDVTEGSGLDVPFYGMGVAVGDYDHDGLVDVFLTGVGANRLFHNQGNGEFRDVTALAGITTHTNEWSTGAAWIDYDNDGDLDLFVCNYLHWSRDLDLAGGFHLPGLGRAYGPPMNFDGAFPRLYRNDGRSRFVDVSAVSGVQVRHPATGLPVAKSLAVAPIDVDNDGWMDLVVANDTVQNFLFRNQHNGTFKEIGALSGVAFDASGSARGAMGIDTARYRNDEAIGVAIGNFANEMNALYVSQPAALVFSDDAVTEGIGHASRELLKFGLFFFDYDLDGRLDLLTANGHLEEDISRVQSFQAYRQPAQLFWNRGTAGGMSFVEVPPAKSGAALFEPMVGRGSAYADIDGDGDLDVVLTQVGGPPKLWRNDQQLPHHWLRLKLVGQRSNRDAIGAWVKARIGRHTLARQVMPTKSYLSQSELPVTIGLGRAARVDALEITWPGGQVQSIPPPLTDREIVVTQETAAK